MDEKETAQLPVSEQEVQIQPPSFLEKLKIHKFKILGGVLGILVFTGAVFGAYKLGRKQVQPGPQPTPLPSEAPAKEGDPTANWETYTNTKLSFLIKYPDEWGVDDSDTGPIEKQINIMRFYKKGLDQSGGPINIPTLAIYIQDNPKNISLGDLEKNFEEPRTFGDAGIVGIKGYDKQYLKENRKVYIANILRNSLIFTFTTLDITASEDIIKTFNLMLSTFKFLE